MVLTPRRPGAAPADNVIPFSSPSPLLPKKHWEKGKLSIEIPEDLALLMALPSSDSFIVRMEPALRQLIRTYFPDAASSELDQVYVGFIQYEIGRDPVTGKVRWRRYSDPLPPGVEKQSFGFYFMSCCFRHIQFLKANSAAPAEGRVPPEVWVPKARFIRDHPLANKNERDNWCGPLLATKATSSISSKQFEYIQSFWNRLRREDTGILPGEEPEAPGAASEPGQEPEGVGMKEIWL